MIIQVLPDWTRLHEWEEGPTIVSHMIAAADLATEQGIETERLAFLCNWIGYYLRFRAEYGKARPYYQRALAIREKALGPDHPDIASTLNNLAILAYYEGDYAAAVRLMRRALTISEQRLGPQHPNTVNSRQSLAVIEAKL